MEGTSTPKLEEQILMEECCFLVAAHLDEVEDHSFGIIYCDFERSLIWSEILSCCKDNR